MAIKTVVKWAGIVAAVGAGVLLVAGVALHIRGGSRLYRTYDVGVTPITVPTDSAAISRGHHLASAMTLCHGCHGEDLSGDPLFEAPMIAAVYAPNLTAGRGGIASSYTDADYVRAIRHGVNPAGRGLMIMHSDAYNHLSGEDLGALIGYLRSVPPVDNELPTTRVATMGRLMVALGLFDTETMPLIPAEQIDHEAPPKAAPPPGPTAAYGEYLASISLCAMCHGSDLTGGPPLEEGGLPAPPIAASAGDGGWTDDQFITTIRTGVNPYGKTLDAEQMPWEFYAKMTDEELAAIWRYVASLRG